MSRSIVIIGAGQAGATAAAELRRLGYDGRLTLIGDELHAPYQRPPLSKDVLLRPETTRTAIFGANFYAENNIRLLTGNAATGIDPTAQRLTLANGESLAWDELLLATGARVRRLPMLEVLGDRLHSLRSLDDAHRMRQALVPGTRLLLVGAGVIGLELASSAVALGARVDVVDQAELPMMRSLPIGMSAFLLETHQSRGVRFHLRSALQSARRDGNEGVLSLDDGRELRGDLLVCGIGVTPDTALAEAAGLHVRREGIVVDARGRTSARHIHAAGDAVCQLLDDGSVRRIESWENANQQALTAAADMLGTPLPAPVVPWFWTDQCGLNIQCAGDMGAARWVTRGTFGQAPFMLFGLEPDGRVVAAITVNQGRDMRPARELIAAQARVDPETLSAPATHLRALARS